MFVGYEGSFRIVRRFLCLFHALEAIDLLIDKQELIRNKVLKANGLCSSDTMDVSSKVKSSDLVLIFYPISVFFFQLANQQLTN